MSPTGEGLCFSDYLSRCLIERRRSASGLSVVPSRMTVWSAPLGWPPMRVSSSDPEPEDGLANQDDFGRRKILMDPSSQWSKIPSLFLQSSYRIPPLSLNPPSPIYDLSISFWLFSRPLNTSLFYQESFGIISHFPHPSGPSPTRSTPIASAYFAREIPTILISRSGRHILPLF